ncbi:MAG: sugar ABC transporter substrate-binding protein [Actinomycetota bacterium]
MAATVPGLTGCGSNVVGSGSSSAPTADGSALAATVAKLQEPLSTYPVPTEPVTGDISSLAGKTVYYIPITFQAPAFTVTAEALATALGTVDVKVQRCDGKANPTDISACVTQATQAGAAGIVTDAIDYALGGNAFDAAQAAGIPMIMTNHVRDEAHPDSDTLVTIPGNGTAMQVALSQWFALDSGGEGNLLINQITNSPSGPVYVEEGQKAIVEECAKCTITINEISSATVSLIEPSTSSALLKDPDIGYVEPQFEAYMQQTLAAVQRSGRINEIKGMTGAAGLGSLQALANGSFLYAAAAPHIMYQGWADADAIIRLALQEPVPEYEIPIRLFTRDIVKTLTLTEDAQKTGEWFGPTTFTDDFAALWEAK